MLKKGHVLIQLEQAYYQSELKLAEAELARIEAGLMEERLRGKWLPKNASQLMMALHHCSVYASHNWPKMSPM